MVDIRRVFIRRHHFLESASVAWLAPIGGAENGLQWVFDVTMNEDQTTNRKEHGPQNTAPYRRRLARLCIAEILVYKTEILP
jgi:hypothetical protein